jgi:hypothetical protein
MTFECNSNGSHMAIVYGSQPCPLCVYLRRITELEREELMSGDLGFISSELLQVKRACERYIKEVDRLCLPKRAQEGVR